MATVPPSGSAPSEAVTPAAKHMEKTEKEEQKSEMRKEEEWKEEEGRSGNGKKPKKTYCSTKHGLRLKNGSKTPLTLTTP